MQNLSISIPEHSFPHPTLPLSLPPSQTLGNGLSNIRHCRHWALDGLFCRCARDRRFYQDPARLRSGPGKYGRYWEIFARDTGEVPQKSRQFLPG